MGNCFFRQKKKAKTVALLKDVVVGLETSLESLDADIKLIEENRRSKSGPSSSSYELALLAERKKERTMDE
jgi:hypothetical protein